MYVWLPPCMQYGWDNRTHCEAVDTDWAPCLRSRCRFFFWGSLSFAGWYVSAVVLWCGVSERQQLAASVSFTFQYTGLEESWRFVSDSWSCGKMLCWPSSVTMPFFSVVFLFVCLFDYVLLIICESVLVLWNNLRKCNNIADNHSIAHSLFSVLCN